MAHKRAWIKGVGIGAAVLVGLLLLGVVVADPLVKRLIERARADLEAQLGRPVALGEVDVSARRGRVQLQHVEIGPTEEEMDAAALTVEAVEVDVGVWRTVRHLGRRIYIQNVEVTRPTVNVVRRDDGTLNWGEISDKLRREPQTDSGAPQRFHIEQGLVSEGMIHFLQAQQPKQRRDTEQVSISQLNLSVAELSNDRGGRLALRAAVLASEPNLKLDAHVQGLDKLPLLAAIHELTLHLSPTPLAPLAPYLSAFLGPENTPEQARFSAKAQFTQAAHEGSKGSGHLTVEGARFPNGSPFDGRLDFVVLTNREAEVLVVERATLDAAEMRIDARAKLSGLTDTPRIEDLELRSRELDFDRIRAHYPEFQSLTAPVELRGPFAIQASGGGSEQSQRLALELTLTQASVHLKDALEKPPGTPAELRARLRNEGDRIDLERGTLQLSDWQLAGTGHAERQSGRLTRYELHLDTTNPAIGGLIRLLPPVANAFSETAAPEGYLQVSAELEGTRDDWRTQAAVQLARVQARAQGTSLNGGGSLQFDVKQRNEQLTGQLKLDLSDFEAIYLDVIHKPRKAPLQLYARVRESGTQRRADFNARVASLSAEGHAVVRPLDNSQAFTAEITLGALQVRPLLALLPTVGDADVPDLRFEAMKLEAAGLTDRPETLELEVTDFAVRSGESDVSGSFRVANPSNPQIAFEARSSYLDLNDLLPETERKEAEPSSLSEADGRLTLDVERGLAAQVPYRNLRARLILKNGRAHAETLEVEAFGGHFSGSGSEFPLFVDDGPYRLKGSAKAVQLEALLGRFAGANQLMTGNLGASFDLAAADTSPKALSRSLTGSLEGRVDEAEFLPGNVVSAFTAQLNTVSGITQLDSQRPGSWQLGELSGTLAFDEGAVVIDEPLKADTPYGPLSLRGKIGLGGPADLTGTLQLRPKALQKLVGADLSLDRSVPLEFRMSGSLEHPKFTIGNLDQALAPLLQAYVKKSVGREAERTLRQAVRGVLAPEGPSEDEPKQDEPKQDEPKQVEPLEEELKRRLEDLF